MKQGRGSRIAASVGAAALIAATQAQAGGADCRRVPVYSAPCFSQTRPHPGCSPIPLAKAPCFVVHGVLAPANGTPALRIHKLGARRVLGVLGGDGDAASASIVPPALRSAMTPASPGDLNSVSGDFTVCPLAAERAGWMQPVCIADAAQVAVVRRRDGADPPRGAPPPTPASRAGSGSPPAPR